LLLEPDFSLQPKLMAATKKRLIKSLESLSEDLKDLLREQYPNGYEASITRITNAKREPIFVFPLETDDAVYLVKVPATKNSDGEYDVESGAKQEFDSSEEDEFRTPPGDDFDGDSDSSDYDEEGGSNSRGNKEASYDPDFDG
jgi:hypothetical protein